METNVTEKEQMFFLGMGEVFRSAAEHDADLVMFKRFMPHASAFEKHALDNGLYAVGRTREDGSCTYMVGRRVAEMKTIPKDVPGNSTYTSIPASTYVEIRTTPRELGAEEQRKTGKWFEEHPEYQVHPDAVGVEYYPLECRSADDTMWTWYPIVPAR